VIEMRDLSLPLSCLDGLKRGFDAQCLLE
jgi:hypothetical protein